MKLFLMKRTVEMNMLGTHYCQFQFCLLLFLLPLLSSQIDVVIIFNMEHEDK